jgi:hypothetical protein
LHAQLPSRPLQAGNIATTETQRTSKDQIVCSGPRSFLVAGAKEGIDLGERATGRLDQRQR